MVTCNYIGRLGNQLYQIAATIAYAKKNNLDFHIPDIGQNENIWAANIKHLTNKDFNKNLEVVYLCDDKKHSYNEFGFDESWRNKNIVFNGFFQSEKYFNNYKNDIITLLGFKWEMKKGVVSIHVRRGDYLEHSDKFNTTSIEYIGNSIDYFTGKGYNSFMVFSDDIDWCKSNINQTRFPKINFTFSDGKKPIEDLELQSHCEHQIISASSFSSWSHILNRNPDKICIAPKKWFGDGNNHLDTTDIYPENSIKI